MDPGPRLTPAHRHARGQLIGTLSGLITVGTEAGRWVVPAANAVWIPPHGLHGAQTHGAFEGWSLYVAGPACIDLPAEPRVLRMNGLLREALQRSLEWSDAQLSERESRLAAVILDEIAGAPIESLALVMPTDHRLKRLVSALLEDLASPLGMQEWALRFGLAPRTLSRRFVLETGLSFTAWRQRARLLRGLELLAAGRPVTHVALELGYETVSAYIALFRRHFGTTPARYVAGDISADRG